MKVAAFSVGNQLFCVDTQDIQGLYFVSSATAVIESALSNFEHTCFNSVLGQSYYLFKANTEKPTQACFLKDYVAAFPFDRLIGVFEITPPSAKAGIELFALVKDASILAEDTPVPVQLLNVKALPAELQKGAPQNTSHTEELCKEYIKDLSYRLTLSTPHASIVVPFETVKKILYKPTLIQKCPIKSNVLGQFKDEYETYDVVSFDSLNTIYDFHVVVEHEGQEVTLNTQSYSKEATPLTEAEYNAFIDFFQSQPKFVKSKIATCKDTKQTTQEDFLCYKSDTGTCAIQTWKVTKISTENSSFKLHLECGSIDYAKEILGVIKAQLKPCPGLPNNKIVVKEGFSALYPHA